MRTIVHVDMDAFYAACEIRENPQLRGIPVIIGGDPLKGRGVVTTCSYEAREYGIHSAMPIVQAYERCPHGIYLRPHFSLYSTISNNIMEILKEFSDVFQRASIDEAYLDASRRVFHYENAYVFGKTIRDTIFEREGISCSVGIAPNKSVAKIASDLEKPGGITVVSEEDLFSFLRPLPVEKISGVGKKTKEILNQNAIKTIKDLEMAEVRTLTRLLGKSGKWLWLVAHGKDDRPVGYRGIIKSMGKEHTFSRDTKNIQDIHATLAWIADRLMDRLEKRNTAFKTVTLKVRLKGFETHTKSKTLPFHTHSSEILSSLACEMFEQFRGRYVRLIGIRLTNLKREKTRQEDLSTWLQCSQQ
ncbi:MAG: DNA polymerase IV [Theionarchaea archaeon]|nr:DNA polymerase IV [Theionarchaea archaeon]